MSRRQAKLAARAAERAKLQKDPRPYDGFAMEASLIAMQEFVPSAYFEAEVAGAERPVRIVTVLPGAVSAIVRAEGDADSTGGESVGGEDAGAEGSAGVGFVALQSQRRGDNPNRDLAYALNWVKNAKPGDSLEVGVADGTEPALTDLLDKSMDAPITVAQDFNWWLTEEQQNNPQVVATLQQANDSVLPSDKVAADIAGEAWWINPSEKAHIRWVRQEKEAELLNALARLHAVGELHLGEGSKFAGVFRTHGVLVPVWDLDNSKDPDDWAEGLETLDKKLAEKLAAEAHGSAAEMNGDEHKAKQTIISREVTIR